MIIHYVWLPQYAKQIIIIEGAQASTLKPTQSNNNIIS